MCDYCERGKLLSTEIDGSAALMVRRAEVGFLVAVFERGSQDPTWVFRVPRCPICGEAHPIDGEPVRPAL